MNKKNDLIKNTIIIFIGRASTQLISLLLLPLYTTYVVTNEYGFIDLISTYVALIVPIITLELDMAVFRYLIDFRQNEEKIKKIISSVLIVFIFIVILLIPLFTIINYFVKFKFAIYILLCIIANMFSLLLTQICRGLGKNKDYSISCALGSTVTILSNLILLIVFNLGGRGMLISMIISYFTMCTYLIIKTKFFKYFQLKYYDRKIMKKLIKYSIPLIPNMISWWIISVFDRTIISLILGTSFVGIYSVSNKFPSLFTGIYNVFHLSWTEQASLHFREGDRDEYFSSVINTGLKIFGSICLIIISGLPLIYKYLVNDSYINSYFQVPILMVAIMCNICIGLISAVYIAEKKSNELAKTSIIAAIINIIVNLLLINKFGLYAASISTFIAYFSMMTFRIFDTQKYIKIKYDFKNICLLIVSFIITFLFYYLNNYYLNYLNFCVITTICILMNKNNLITILNKLKKKGEKNEI